MDKRDRRQWCIFRVSTPFIKTCRGRNYFVSFHGTPGILFPIQHIRLSGYSNFNAPRKQTHNKNSVDDRGGGTRSKLDGTTRTRESSPPRFIVYETCDGGGHRHCSARVIIIRRRVGNLTMFDYTRYPFRVHHVYIYFFCRAYYTGN